LPVDGRTSTAVKTPCSLSSYIAVHRYLTSVLPSDREFEVLRSLGSGLAVKEVAESADLIRYVRENELLK
jgi:hypothetical protein